MDNGRRRMGTRSTSPGGGAAFVRVHPPVHRKTKSQDQRRVSLGAARAFRATNPRHKVGSDRRVTCFSGAGAVLTQVDSPPRDEDQQDSRPVIGWMMDEAGWAFALNAQRIANLLPGYRHKAFVMQAVVDDQGTRIELELCHIVMCPFAPWLSVLKSHANVVACLKSIKVFD